MIEFVVGLVVGVTFCYLVVNDVVAILEERIRILERDQINEREEHFRLTNRIREYMDAVKKPSQN